MIGFMALSACAGPSPEIRTTAADTSEPATAPAGTADESMAAAAASSAPEDDPGASDTAASSADSAASAPAPEPAAESEPPAAAEAADENEAPPEAVGADAETEPVAESAPPSAEEQPTLVAVAPADPWDMGEPGLGLGGKRPYVVIRFAEDAGDYEPALAQAVRQAVSRHPDVAFDLVAVTPRAGNAEDLADDRAQAQAQAAAVMKSLADLGMGADRVRMRAWTGQPTDVNEIRLYIR
jgi:hypothetical protein